MKGTTTALKHPTARCRCLHVSGPTTTLAFRRALAGSAAAPCQCAVAAFVLHPQPALELKEQDLEVNIISGIDVFASPVSHMEFHRVAARLACVELAASAAAETAKCDGHYNGNGSVPVPLAFRHSIWCQGAVRFPFCDGSKRCTCGGARPRGSAPTVHMCWTIYPWTSCCSYALTPVPANAAAEGAGSGGNAQTPADAPGAASLLTSSSVEPLFDACSKRFR